MITLLVSCLSPNYKNLNRLVKDCVRSDVRYVIVFQNMSVEGMNEFVDNNSWATRSDVTLVLNNSIGVTKSRNHGLSLVKNGIVLFADDDTVLADDWVEALKASKLLFPRAAFFSFNVSDFNGNLLKRIPVIGKHTKFSILSLGTVQIAVHLDNIQSDIWFPENLGAGAYFPCCDEPVYLSRILDLGVYGVHFDKVIVRHPPVSSGISLKGYRNVFSRLIAFRMIFGVFGGTLVFLVFIAKNFRRILF